MTTSDTLTIVIDSVNAQLAENALCEEQIECLRDIDRHTESFAMLDDSVARVGMSEGVLRPLYRALVARLPEAQYVREFPAYGALDFTVPEGFEDISWHNDVCPSFAGKGFLLWADFKMVEWRELADTQRFALCLYDAENGPQPDDFLISSDNFDEIAAFVKATEKHSTEQRKFIGQRVTRAKAEVLAAVGLQQPFYTRGKVVPFDISGFSDLHDYCDANCLGGMCEDGTWEEGDRLFPDPETPSDDSAWIKACNIIMDAVHLWIVNGTMRQQALAIRDKHKAQSRITETA